MGSRRWRTGEPARDVGGVVVGVDEDGAAAVATEWAAAEAFGRGLPLELVTAHPVLPDLGLSEWYDPVVASGPGGERARQAADEVRTAVQRAWPGLPVTTRLVDGPVTGVLRQAADTASLVVLGRRPGRWTSRLVAGLHPVPTGRRLAGRLRCPLVVVGDRVAPRPETVVGWDGSPAACAAAEFAADRVVTDRGTLTLVQVRCGPGRSAQQAAAADRVGQAVAVLRRRRPALAARGRLVEAATVAEGLLQAASGARLLVVGAAGPVRNWTWPGSRARGHCTTSALLGAGPPVAVVPLVRDLRGRAGRSAVTHRVSNRNSP